MLTRFKLCLLFPFLSVLSFSASAQSDACWVQHRATVYEWTCAAKSLPLEGKPFALSIVVVQGKDALMVLDSGATAAVGEQAALAIRTKFGVQPIWLINSQPKPEHVLGNVGFRSVFSRTLKPGEEFSDRVVAGKTTAELMKRCPTCIQNFAMRLGNASVAGTESLVPKRILRSATGHLGSLSGDWVGWQYRLVKNLETEEGLVLRHSDLNLWWVGSAVQNLEIPDLYDGDIIARINYLGRLKARLKGDDSLLTSFGLLSHDWVHRNLTYFVGLQQQIIEGIEAGTPEVELINALSANMGQYKNPVYVQTDTQALARELETHQLNIQRIYRQTETLVF